MWCWKLVNRSRMRVYVSVALCLFGCGGDEGGIDAEQCLRVRERIVDLALGSESPGAPRDHHRVVIQRALGQEFVSHCERDMREDHADCILSAADSKAVAACSSQFAK